MDWGDAFNTGTAGTLEHADSLLTIQSVSALAVILWFAWVCVVAYKDYGDSALTSGDMVFLWLRALFTFTVLLFLLVN